MAAQLNKTDVAIVLGLFHHRGWSAVRIAPFVQRNPKTVRRVINRVTHRDVDIPDPGPAWERRLQRYEKDKARQDLEARQRAKPATGGPLIPDDVEVHIYGSTARTGKTADTSPPENCPAGD